MVHGSKIYPRQQSRLGGMAVDECANFWPGGRPAWALVRCHGLCPRGSTFATLEYRLTKSSRDLSVSPSPLEESKKFHPHGGERSAAIRNDINLSRDGFETLHIDSGEGALTDFSLCGSSGDESKT